MAGVAAVIWLFFVEEMTVERNMNSTVPAAAMKREEDQQLIPKMIKTSTHVKAVVWETQQAPEELGR
jgi:hypothetical protein